MIKLNLHKPHRHKWKALMSDLTEYYGTIYCTKCLKTKVVIHDIYQQINAKIILSIRESDSLFKRIESEEKHD